METTAGARKPSRLRQAWEYCPSLGPHSRQQAVENRIIAAPDETGADLRGRIQIAAVCGCLVNHDRKVGIEALGENVVEQHRQRLPEMGALAFALQRQ